MNDIIAGCLIGCAVGDALGVCHEFSFHRSNIYTGILYIEPEFHFRCGSRKDVVGQYSDDTEMTLCTVRSIIESAGIYNRKLTIRKYQEWASTSKSMGRNTRALFKGVKTIQGYQSRYDKMYKGTDPSTWTQSNGSLMRCSILSFFADAAVQDCIITNPHRINIDSNKLYSFLIKSCAQKHTKKRTIKRIRELDLCDEVMDVFIEATSSLVPHRNIAWPNKGWVLHSLYCAIWAWYYAESYQDGIDTIIRLGGDTDTNPAIAGSLLGAKLGFESMLNEKRTFINVFTVLNIDLTKGDNPRPKWLTLHDFYDMVNELARLVERQDRI